MQKIRFRYATVQDALELARLLIETNEATFRGLVPDRCLTSLSLEESAANWRKALSAGGPEQGKFLIVAEQIGAGDEPKGLLGYVLAGRDSKLANYESELNVLMVDTPW